MCCALSFKVLCRPSQKKNNKITDKHCLVAKAFCSSASSLFVKTEVGLFQKGKKSVENSRGGYTKINKKKFENLTRGGGNHLF